MAGAAWPEFMIGGDYMVYEMDIRRELNRVVVSRDEPMAKTRKLLALSERVRSGAWRLAECTSMLLADGLEDQAARMRASTQRLLELNEEIREAARTTLVQIPGTEGEAEAAFAAFLG